MRMMRLSEIKIKDNFANTIPSKEKINECREFWRYEGKQDRPIVLSSKGYLVDGYVMYLILMEHKEEYAMVRKLKKPAYRNKTTTYIYGTHPNSKDIKTPTTYVFGVHPNSNCTKEFCWRVPASWGNWADNIAIGDTVMCQTKFGFSPVVVNRVEVLDKPPVEMRIKKVARREIRRNGAFVE